MNTCTALRSLALCIFCEGAEDIRAMLRAYTQFFHDHRDAFLHLASVRIEMQLTSRGAPRCLRTGFTGYVLGMAPVRHDEKRLFRGSGAE